MRRFRATENTIEATFSAHVAEVYLAMLVQGLTIAIISAGLMKYLD